MAVREFVTHGVEETEALGRAFAKELRPGDVVALRGTLGAGKTAFVRGIAAQLAPQASVSSPTFAIMNEYRGEMPLFHFDLYRIGDAEELDGIGFEEFFEKQNGRKMSEKQRDYLLEILGEAREESHETN